MTILTLGDWDKTSSVRARPYRYDCSDNNIINQLKMKSWFVFESIAILNHQAINAVSAENKNYLLACYMINFLEYTTILEHDLANQAATIIAHNRLSIDLPISIRLEALKLYTDEGYHAYFSADVAEQIAKIMDVKLRQPYFPKIERLKLFANQAPQRFQSLTWFAIGFVSETVITKSFLYCFRSTLLDPIYNLLGDHLHDERKHAKYFSDLFTYVWERISNEEQAYLGDILPKIIKYFFSPHHLWLEHSLQHIGINHSIITEIITTYDSSANFIKRVRDGASATLYALEKSGVFKNASIRKNFNEEELILKK